MPAPGVVAVREYGSSPRHRHRSVSTKIDGLLLNGLGRTDLGLGKASVSGRPQSRKGLGLEDSALERPRPEDLALERPRPRRLGLGETSASKTWPRETVGRAWARLWGA